jgi:hypothetical protein
MMKKVLIALLLGMTTLAFAEGKPQTSCPVMGGKINPKQYVDAEGYRIYVCCGGCIGKIKADPEKHIEKLQAEGVELEKTPEPKK